MISIAQSVASPLTNERYLLLAFRTQKNDGAFCMLARDVLLNLPIDTSVHQRHIYLFLVRDFRADLY
jgi:hypothetical protein